MKVNQSGNSARGSLFETGPLLWIETQHKESRFVDVDDERGVILIS